MDASLREPVVALSEAAATWQLPLPARAGTAQEPLDVARGTATSPDGLAAEGPIICWQSGRADPLPYYKTREPFRPRSQSSQRSYHPKRGFKVVDHETICVPARDKVRRTRQGISRCSRGAEVVYSASQWQKLELDGEDLLRIMRELAPANQKVWTLQRIDKMFFEFTGRRGCWVLLGLPFEAYLALFPRTFEVYGGAGYGRCVRALHGAMARVADKGEDVMIRLAIALKTGRVEAQPPFEEPPSGRRSAALVREEASRPATRLGVPGTDRLVDTGTAWGSAAGIATGIATVESSAGADATRKLPGLLQSHVKAVYRPSSAPCAPVRGAASRLQSGAGAPAALVSAPLRPRSSPLQ